MPGSPNPVPRLILASRAWPLLSNPGPRLAPPLGELLPASGSRGPWAVTLLSSRGGGTVSQVPAGSSETLRKQETHRVGGGPGGMAIPEGPPRGDMMLITSATSTQPSSAFESDRGTMSRRQENEDKQVGAAISAAPRAHTAREPEWPPSKSHWVLLSPGRSVIAPRPSLCSGGWEAQEQGAASPRSGGSGAR